MKLATHRMRSLGVVALAVGLLACSGDAEPAADTTTSPAAASSATATATPESTATDSQSTAANVLRSTDGSYQAALPEGFVDIRALLDEDERDVALGELGVDLPEGELSDLVAGMSLQAIPWIATDLVNATATFAPTVNAIAVPGTGGAPLSDLLDQFNAQNGGFGEEPSGDRAIQDVGGREAIVYEYTQALSEPPVELRGTQVATYSGEDLYLITYAAPDAAWDDSVVATVAGSIESLG